LSRNLQQSASAIHFRRMMRPSLLAALLVVFGIALGAHAQQAHPKTVKVQDGTIVHVILTQDLNSKKDQENDPVHGKVAKAIKVGDVVVIAKGAAVIGHITKAHKGGRWGHSGTLAYTLDYVKAIDGSNVRLKASYAGGGQQSRGALIMGLSGAFVHGKNVDVPKGTSINAYVDGDHEVTVPAGGH